MSIDQALAEIFEKWSEYDYVQAQNIKEKKIKKEERNRLIRKTLDERGAAHVSEDDFLRNYLQRYRDWLNSEGLRRRGERF